MPGPGWDRYRARLDAETLRQRVLREQEEAANRAAGERKKVEAVTRPPRECTTGPDDYPPPAQRRGRIK